MILIGIIYHYLMSLFDITIFISIRYHKICLMHGCCRFTIFSLPRINKRNNPPVVNLNPPLVYYKVTGKLPATLPKRGSNIIAFLNYFRLFLRSSTVEHLQMSATDHFVVLDREVLLLLKGALKSSYLRNVQETCLGKCPFK